MEQVKYKGFYINIKQDDCIDSPRNWDNLATFGMRHNRYTLGDKKFMDCKSGHELIESILGDVLDDNYKAEKISSVWIGTNTFINKAVYIIKKLCPVVLPLYLLDHSGLWLSTGKFSCDPGGWDTSFVGFAYVKKDTLLKEYGNLTDDTIVKATECVLSEVETYSKYLAGDVYGYFINPIVEASPIICNDSCCGFYDIDDLLNDAKSIIDYSIQEYKKERLKITHFMNNC